MKYGTMAYDVSPTWHHAETGMTSRYRSRCQKRAQFCRLRRKIRLRMTVRSYAAVMPFGRMKLKVLTVLFQGLIRLLWKEYQKENQLTLHLERFIERCITNNENSDIMVIITVYHDNKIKYSTYYSDNNNH